MIASTLFNRLTRPFKKGGTVMQTMKVSFKVLNQKNEELRTIMVEVEPGKGWKKRAEDEALKQIAEKEKIELVPPDQQQQTSDQKSGLPAYIFEFNYLVNGDPKRKEEITVQAETREYAWRRAVEIARSREEQGETAQFVKEILPK